MIDRHDLAVHLLDRKEAREPFPRHPAPAPAKTERVEHPGGKDRSTDRAVDAVGHAKHPAPNAIAEALEGAAQRLRKHGLDAIDMVSLLGARGYSASTLGDGGSRGTDATSSTERHAQRGVEYVDRWTSADAAYHRDLADLWKLAGRVTSATDEILRHAQDVDPTPAGTGECKGCAMFCRPTEDRPGFRIVSGLCPTCYRAWRRYVTAGGDQIRGEWASRRRESFTERDANGQVVQVHTPEPDHDIDLTTERPADMP